VSKTLSQSGKVEVPPIERSGVSSVDDIWKICRLPANISSNFHWSPVKKVSNRAAAVIVAPDPRVNCFLETGPNYAEILRRWTGVGITIFQVMSSSDLSFGLWCLSLCRNVSQRSSRRQTGLRFTNSIRIGWAKIHNYLRSSIFRPSSDYEGLVAQVLVVFSINCSRRTTWIPCGASGRNIKLVGNQSTINQVFYLYLDSNTSLIFVRSESVSWSRWLRAWQTIFGSVLSCL
jgi:hypothetical protein